MKDTKLNPQRRTLLKSAALGSAVISTGLPNFALAALSPAKNIAKNTGLSALSMMSIKQNQTQATKSITLTNRTNKVVRLHSIRQEGFSTLQGSLKVEARYPKATKLLQPNQELVINLKATTANAGLNTSHAPISNVVNARLHISSDHAAFNGTIPVTAIDAMPV